MQVTNTSNSLKIKDIEFYWKDSLSFSLSIKEFNISSPMQIGQIFETLGIESSVMTPKGKPSWNEAALVNINNRIAGLVRQHRTLAKLMSINVSLVLLNFLTLVPLEILITLKIIIG